MDNAIVILKTCDASLQYQDITSRNNQQFKKLKPK